MKKSWLFLIPVVFILIGCPSPQDDPEPVYKTLTLNTSGGGSGAISANPSPGDDGYLRGTTVTLTAAPDPDNTFLRWEGADEVSGETATVVMNTDKTVTAVFERDTETFYILNLASDPADTADFSVFSGSQFLDGEVVDITVTPHAGYSFDAWADGPTDNPRTVTMSSNSNLTANMNSKHTIIVHFAIDNNIDYEFEDEEAIISNYLATLESVKANDTNDMLNIIVYMDGCQSNPTYTSPFADGYYVLSGGDFADDLVKSISEVNSGSLTETKSMLNWVVSNYPGGRYFYSVFNHGGGFNDSNSEGTYGTVSSKGIGFDDSADDALSHYELGQAVAYLKSLIGKNVDIFYPYACLMGGVELAYEVRDSADYLLFSEEVFPADYWSYEALEEINTNIDITSEALGTAFCNDAYDYFDGYRAFTLALVDLAEIGSLVTALDTLADAAILDINDNGSVVSEYNDAADTALCMNENYYVDIDSLMTELQVQTNIAAAVKTAAGTVQSELSDAIAYFQSYNITGASGMSVYNYHWYEGSYPSTIYNSILQFGQDTDWGDYQQLLFDERTSPVSPDGFETDHNSNETAADAKSITVGAAAQEHTFHDGDPYDAVRMNLTTGTTYLIQTAENGDAPADIPAPDLAIILLSSPAIDEDNVVAFGMNGTPSTLFTCPATGTYYLIIQDMNGYETYYDLAVNEYVIEEDGYESDDTSGNASTITVDGGAQSHTLHESTDVDWVRFSTTAGQTYTVETYSGPDNTILDMYLYDGDDLDTVIDEGYEGYNCHVDSADAGWYYVEVVSWADSIGNYTIEVGSGYYSLDNERVDFDFSDLEWWQH